MAILKKLSEKEKKQLIEEVKNHSEKYLFSRKKSSNKTKEKSKS